MKYTIWDERGIRAGSAEEILYSITQKKSDLDSEISRMTTDEYADALIKNASHFLPSAVVEELRAAYTDRKYDLALNLLSNMPASNTHILRAEREEPVAVGA